MTLLEELIRAIELWLRIVKEQVPLVDPTLDPVLLVPGIAGSILEAVDEAGNKERVWVRILAAEHEFREKLWSRFDASTGRTVSVNEKTRITVPEDRYGLYAIDTLDPDMDASFLYMGRLLEGFGVGIISYTVSVYIAEISPQNMRGALGSVNQLSVTLGILLAYLLGMFVPWRLLAVMGALPCTVLIPGLFFIPESPRWLAKMNLMEDCETSLQVLRGFETDITAEVNDIKRAVSSASKRTTISFQELNQKKYRTPLILGIGLLVLQNLSGINGILFYASNIFKAAGVTNSDLATCSLGAIQVLATGVTTWLLDRAGRRILLIISTSGMTLCLLAVSVVSFLKDNILFALVMDEVTRDIQG